MDREREIILYLYLDSFEKVGVPIGRDFDGRIASGRSNESSISESWGLREREREKEL